MAVRVTVERRTGWEETDRWTLKPIFFARHRGILYSIFRTTVEQNVG